MRKAIFRQSFFYSAVLTTVALVLLNVGHAQVRSSTNYQLQSDSINIGGGYSTSTSYRQESTFGEVATGISTSSSYSLRAGYQQLQEVYLSLAGTGNVVMSPSLPGITGGTANGSTTFTVITDSPSGYQLTIEAENSPAMQSGANSIADYVPAGSADYTFTVPATEARFGYSIDGVDEDVRFQDAGGSACGAGTAVSLSCWDGLSTTAEQIATNANANHPAGATTTVNFRVLLMPNANITSGEYYATSTVTALPL